MSQTVAAPATAPAPSSGPLPPQITIQTGSSLLQRVLCWLGWTGCLIFLMLFAGLSYSLREYFDTTHGIQERYHSGTKHARDKIAVITVDGVILEGRGFVKHQIDRVRDDENVKAVVVRVNSPGGTITGSDYIHHHLAKLRQEKKVPMVVSMGGVAASGGYYLAMAVGDQPKSIYAEPTTTTGSIGVIVPHYDLSGLLTKFNVKDDSIVSHPRKQLLAMTRPVSDEDRKILQAYVNEAFGRFKDIVQGGRPVFRKAPQKLDELATGEIFTAGQAKKFDEVGQLAHRRGRAGRCAAGADGCSAGLRWVELGRAGAARADVATRAEEVHDLPVDDRVVIAQPHLHIGRRIRRHVIGSVHPAEIVLLPILCTD